MTTTELQHELDRQADRLVVLNYPKLSGLTAIEFRDKIKSLKSKLVNLELPDIDYEQGRLPFVIVVKSDLINTKDQMNQVTKDGKLGVVKLDPLNPSDFDTIESVNVPDDQVYLLLDIDRGKSYLYVRPKDALELITKSNRSPLTIDEGVAIVTHFPEFLARKNCFSLLASRHIGDKRVPAIWINANKHPNLGWCWDGNPHTWLGSASCKLRC